MAERTTLAALAAQVAAIRAQLAERERQEAEDAERRARVFGEVVEILREKVLPEERRKQFKVIPGSCKRRTKRRGQLRLVS